MFVVPQSALDGMIVCADCHEVFSTKKSMQRHRKYHCPLRPDLSLSRPDNAVRFVCGACGKDMLARDRKKHMRRLHPELLEGSDWL